MRLIDADALMEASKYEFWQDVSAITPIGEYILKKFRQLIRNTPTVTPEPKWIPCSERLPQVDGEYLVCERIAGNLQNYSVAGYANDLYKVDEYDFNTKKGKSGWWYCDDEYGYLELKNVTAWVMLPEPYKEGERNG